jgi:carbamoyl-phosphate synthase large subunit
MKKIFLLSSIGGDLSQSIVRCLRDEYPELSLVGTDTHSHHSGSLFVDEFIVTEPVSSPRYFDSLIKILNSLEPDFYFPLNEVELLKLSSLSPDELGSIFKSTKIIWSGADVLKKFLTKTSTMSFLNSINLQIPRTYSLGIEDFSFPLVVKPNQGSGSKNFYICNDLQELEASLVFVKDPIIQEYIPGPDSEFTIGVFALGGKQVRSIAFRRRLSTGGGTSWCEHVIDPEIDEICVRIAQAVNLNGSLNIQLRKNSGKYFIFEINPRFSSTVHIRSQLGFKDVIWSINEEYDQSFTTENLATSSKFGVFTTGVRLE